MVTPYWPPVNKVGVWRVIRTARYLPERGWTPIICTPRPEQVYKDPPLSDASFETPDYEVIRPDTWIPSVATIRGFAQPHTWVKQLQALGLPQPISRALSRMTGLLDRGSTRIVAEILAPDQFVEWGVQAARQLKDRRDVDVVWATGGPFGFFVADFRVADLALFFAVLADFFFLPAAVLRFAVVFFLAAMFTNTSLKPLRIEGIRLEIQAIGRYPPR